MGTKENIGSIVELYLAQVITVMVFLLLSNMEQLAVIGRTVEAHCLDTTSFPVLLLTHWIALDLLVNIFSLLVFSWKCEHYINNATYLFSYWKKKR